MSRHFDNLRKAGCHKMLRLCLLTASFTSTSAWAARASTALPGAKIPSVLHRASVVSKKSPDVRSASVPAGAGIADDVSNDEKAWRRVFKDRVPVSFPDITLVAAGLATWGLHNFMGLTPVLSSCLVGCLCGLMLPTPAALSSYCGSFAGMATTRVIPSASIASLVCVTCAIFLRLFNRFSLLVGRGGRLGLVAQLACTWIFVCVRLVWGGPHAAAARPWNMLFCREAYCFALVKTIPVALLGSTLGTVGTKLWQRTFRGRPRLDNLVTSSSAIGLLACIALPKSLHMPVFAGTFVAMSSAAVLPSNAHLLAASMCCGIWQAALAGVLNGGWGGKLGTAAALGVMTADARKR